jgi:hypothetical protein|tara:strand:- start:954 stop:1268 length:315 start_codon:yes stop_codon:yes gene_type:complete
MLVREASREQHDQSEFKVGAFAAFDVFILRSWGGPLTVMGAFKGALLHYFGCSVLVSAPKTDYDAALQTTEHTLKHDGSENQEGCEAGAHRSESISPSWGRVQS